MDMLITLIAIIISQCIHILNHHIVDLKNHTEQLKYIQFLLYNVHKIHIFCIYNEYIVYIMYTCITQ